MGDADSVIIDPHKLGYVPYPAGIVAFRNGIVTDFLTQEANYISSVMTGMTSIDEQIEIRNVGPYILEGSKPGAAAAACWLAHKTIPLEVKGHGQIMRETLLSAGRFARYLDFHRHLYAQFERALAKRGAPAGAPFTFVRLFSPDTNIVCFVARPMALRSESLIQIDCSLEKINAINKEIYARLGRPSSESEEQTPYGHPYFVSRTVFPSSQYTAKSMSQLLKRVGVSASEYNKHGLFVLRSTVMNPHYHMAAQDRDRPSLQGLPAGLRQASSRRRETGHVRAARLAQASRLVRSRRVLRNSPCATTTRGRARRRCGPARTRRRRERLVDQVADVRLLLAEIWTPMHVIRPYRIAHHRLAPIRWQCPVHGEDAVWVEVPEHVEQHGEWLPFGGDRRDGRRA